MAFDSFAYPCCPHPDLTGLEVVAPSTHRTATDRALPRIRGRRSPARENAPTTSFFSMHPYGTHASRPGGPLGRTTPATTTLPSPGRAVGLRNPDCNAGHRPA